MVCALELVTRSEDDVKIKEEERVEMEPSTICITVSTRVQANRSSAKNSSLDMIDPIHLLPFAIMISSSFKIALEDGMYVLSQLVQRRLQFVRTNFKFYVKSALKNATAVCWYSKPVTIFQERRDGYSTIPKRMHSLSQTCQIFSFHRALKSNNVQKWT